MLPSIIIPPCFRFQICMHMDKVFFKLYKLDCTGGISSNEENPAPTWHYSSQLELAQMVEHCTANAEVRIQIPLHY